MAKKKPEAVPASKSSGWSDPSKHWADWMADGLARGFPGDTRLMRYEYRTPAAIRYHAEKEGKGIEEVKVLIEQHWNREEAKVKQRIAEREKK